MPDALKRSQQRVDPVGEEPDYRFSLANERTFLAWVRTALAVMAAAVAIVQFVHTGRLHELRRELGLVLAALGLLISCTMYQRWAANQRAIRLKQPLPPARLLLLVAAALVIVAGSVIALVAGS